MLGSVSTNAWYWQYQNLVAILVLATGWGKHDEEDAESKG